MKYSLLSVLVAFGLASVYWLRPVAPAPRGPAHADSPKPLVPAPRQPLDLPDFGPAATIPPASTRDLSADLSKEIHHVLRSRGPVDLDRLVNDLLPKLVARDPAAATGLVAALEAGPLREVLLRQLARLMSAADIHATLAWLVTLPAADQTSAVEAVIAQVNQSDPAGAMSVAAEFGIGLADGRQEHVMQLWTEQDPARAVAWITAQPAGPSRDRLLARTAYVRAQQEPVQAAGLVLDQMSAGPAQGDALMVVVRQWAVRDPAGAADWVKLFPHGPLLRRAQAELETARKLR